MIMQVVSFSNASEKNRRIEEPEGAFQHFMAAPAKSSGHLPKIASDWEMLEHRTDGYIRDMNFKSDQEFSGYCNGRLAFFLENLPKMTGFMLGGMESSRKEFLLQRAAEIASTLKANGLQVVLQSEGLVGYGDGRIYLKPWFGSSDPSNTINKLGLDGILLHEFFHAVQYALIQSGLPCFSATYAEATADLFAFETIPHIFDIVPKSDTPTSYRLFFPYYLTNRATDGAIIDLALDFDFGRLQKTVQDASATLEVPERLVYLALINSDTSPLDGRLGALIAEAMPTQKRQNYMAAFEAECGGAKESTYALPRDFIKGFDSEIKLMAQDAEQEKNAIFAQSAAAMFFNANSKYVLDPPHSINERNPEFAFPISLYCAQKILGKSENEHAKKVAGMLGEMLKIIDLERFEWSNAGKMNLDLVDINEVEKSLAVQGQISPSIKDANSGISASFVVPDLLTGTGNSGEKVASSYGFSISPIALNKWITGSRVLTGADMVHGGFSREEIELFPNPAKTMGEILVRLRAPSNADKAVVKIYDVLGREMRLAEFPLQPGENALNLGGKGSALPSGTYFCQLALFDAFGKEIEGRVRRAGKFVIAK